MHVPIRTCVACRRSAARSALVRLAVVDGTVVVDAEASKPGRGAYLCQDSACLRAVLSDRGRRLLQRLCRSAEDRARVTVDTERLAAQWRAAGQRMTTTAAAVGE